MQDTRRATEIAEEDNDGRDIEGRNRRTGHCRTEQRQIRIARSGQ